MAKLFNRAKMTISVGGSATVTLGSAVSPFQTFASSGVANSDIVPVLFEDGTDWELSTATYNSSTTQLSSRTLVQSTTGSLLNLSTNATASITPFASTIGNKTEANTWTSAQTFNVPIGVTSGGTGTSTQFTAGSVVFAGASGVYSQKNANLFWDNTNNRLGIGTSSPAAILDIRGTNILIGDSSTDATAKTARLTVPHYTNAEAPVAFFNTASQSTVSNVSIGGGSGSFNACTLIQFFTAANTTTLTGSERMRIDASGNVGIGLTPTYRVDAYDTSTTDITVGRFLSPAAASGTSFTYLRLEKGTNFGAAIGGYLTQGVGPGMTLSTISSGSLTERMRIDSAGNVGIGTSSPAYRLDVNGSPAIVVRDSATDATNKFGRVGGAHYTNSQLPMAAFVTGSTSSTNVLYIGGGSGAFNAATSIQFYTAADNVTATGTERMRINSNGTVSIGAVGGTVALEVTSAPFTSYSPMIATQFLTGTASATSGNAGAGLAFRGYYVGTTTSTEFAMISGIKENTTDNNFSGALLFGTRLNAGGVAIERMRIDSVGNVGIGTTSPNYKLHISTTNPNTAQYVQFTNGSTGSTSSDGMLVGVDGLNEAIVWMQESAALKIATANTERMRIDSAGKVGIGTSSLQGKLTVSGVDSATSYLALTLNGGASGYGSAIQFTDGVTYNYACGTTTNGDFAWWSGRFAGNAGTERMRIDSAGLVGINTTTSTNTQLTIGGTAPSVSNNSFSVNVSQTIPATTTSLGTGISASVSTAASAFTAASVVLYNASQGTIGAGSAITSQYGFYVNSNLTGATNNYGFYSNIASGTGRWNFYANGTAQNYFAGDTGVGIAPDGTQILHVAAGSTSKAPIELNSGTLMTSVDAGSMEYDGTNLYFAANATEGRGFVECQQMFKLTAAGSTIGNTIANFFGANSNIPLVASGRYEIEIVLFYVKGSTQGAVTWTLTNSAAPTAMDVTYEMSPITGLVAPPGTATMLVGHAYNNTTAAYTVTTGTITASTNNYARFKIFLVNGSGTSLKIQATVGTGNNNITPGIGSYWKCTRLPGTNTGSYAA